MATTKNKKAHSSANLSLTRVTRTMYFLIGFYVLSIIIFDSGNLITKESVVDRASAAFALLVVNTLAWYVASEKVASVKNIFVYILTLSLVILAALTTYWERGMASSSTILYILPMLVVAVLKNRHALLATAALCAGSYCFAAVKYFNDFFNEGYRIQLWGNLVLYSGVIFASAWLIMIIADLRRDSH